MLKPTKILVPTDFSEYSDQALQQALDIARQYKAKVYVLHVMHDYIYASDIVTQNTLQQIENDLLDAEWENVRKQLDKFPQTKDVEVNTDIKKGLHYKVILEEADRLGIDLIVIASLGKSGIAKYLIGSVARNILKGAKCPVLLTK